MAIALLIIIASAIIYTTSQRLSGMPPKIFLEESESTIILPHNYLDENIYTDFITEGSSVSIHEAIEARIKYTSQIIVANNSLNQPLMDVCLEPISNSKFLFYISSGGFLRWAELRDDQSNIQQLF